MKTIPDEAKEILKIIHAHHYDAFFVGGCVRDLLLKKDIKDIDIATSALPDEIIGIFPTVIPVGIEHGTVIVRHKGQSYEVTTFRRESGYSNQRHPDMVKFITNIEEDLKRRDFTMNAIAMNMHGKLLDPFFGQIDIQKNIIRTVGSPRERLKEDALRIIRALRFSSQLGFSIEAQTLQQMKLLANHLEYISVERITLEITKFFQGESIEKGQYYLNKTGIVKYLPVFKDEPKLAALLPLLTTSFSSFAEVIALMHLMFPKCGINTWIKEWKCSNKDKEMAKKLVYAVQYTRENRIDNWVLYRLEERMIPMFVHMLTYILPKLTITVNELLARKRLISIQKREEICVNGNDIMEYYVQHRKGPWLGKMLHEIEYNIVMGKLKNKKSDIKEWIICHPPEKK